MKRFAAALILALGVSAASANDDGDEVAKIMTVGKSALKIDSKITDDDKKHDYKIVFPGGKEIDLRMRAKVYAVKLEAGIKYTITMDTKDKKFDPFLVVLDSSGKMVAFDDDSGATPESKYNAKLSYTPAKLGVFHVHAAALRGKASYTLTIVAVKPGANDKALAVGKDGLTISGKLTEDHRKIVYLVKMQGGKAYRIDLKSNEFDAYLFLHNADGKKLAEDDDSGGDLNSRIVFKADADGTYRITATSLGMRENGAFTLEVREED